MNLMQQQFVDALFDRDRTGLHDFIQGSSDALKSRRLDIYRNNVFYSLGSALGDLYPVVKKLTGADFFNATASVYLHKHPPRRAAMVDFGEEFPDFLQQFEHTVSLPWLADVARLELMWHQSFHATDLDSLGVNEFAAIPVDELVTIRLAVHPSIRLLVSRYPILQIWEANQDGHADDESIDLDAGGEAVCIYRYNNEVLLTKQDLPSCILLMALGEGETLGDAASAAQAIAPDYTPTIFFAQCINAGYFTNITRGKDYDGNLPQHMYQF